MAGEGIVFVLRLYRECVGVEPVHEWLVESQADIRHLRSMNMRVDEAWQEELRLAEMNFAKLALLRMVPG